MAMACACDRCGAFYVPKKDSKKRYIIHDRENPCTGWNKDYLDLCDDCYGSFERFMDEPRNLQII